MNLYAHHGPVVVHKLMRETMIEIQLWGRANPSELIVITVSHCVTERFHNNYYSGECRSAALQLLYDLNIHTVTNCDDLKNMTYAKAIEKGTILAVFGCSYGFCDPSITCYMVENSVEYVCYDTSRQPNSTSLPWSKLTSFLIDNTFQPPVTDGILWSIGGNWQSSAESDVLGTFHNSSILLDEERSGLNKWLISFIRNGNIKYMNLFGVDNVCDNGLEIVSAINDYYYN